MGARWAIGGSIASTTYGEPRATNDVDIVAELDESQAREFCERLGTAFHADADTAVDAVRRRSSFHVIDTRSFIKIDVFVPPEWRDIGSVLRYSASELDDAYLDRVAIGAGLADSLARARADAK